MENWPQYATPGPWYVATSKEPWERGSEQYSVRAATVEPDICDMTSARPPAAVLANALLISAAPNLYEACQAMLPWVIKGIESGAFSETVLPRVANAVVHRAVRALNRAEGRIQ